MIEGELEQQQMDVFLRATSKQEKSMMGRRNVVALMSFEDKSEVETKSVSLKLPLY